MLFFLFFDEAGWTKDAAMIPGKRFRGAITCLTSRRPWLVPASVKSLKALGLIGTLACFDNATQSVLTPAAEAASTETRLHNYAALFSRDACASANTSD